jgi:hypothetical protein
VEVKAPGGLSFVMCWKVSAQMFACYLHPWVLVLVPTHLRSLLKFMCG